LRLLVDEDTEAKTLVRLLREAGHDVLTVLEAGLSGHLDPEVLARGTGEDRVVLTRNCGDFAALHAANPAHAGIIGIYQDADPLKTMNYGQVVAAIANFVATSAEAKGQFIPLNAWRW